MLRSYKYRLFTTDAQEVALTAMLGAFCDLYNACLQGVTYRIVQNCTVRWNMPRTQALSNLLAAGNVPPIDAITSNGRGRE